MDDQYKKVHILIPTDFRTTLKVEAAKQDLSLQCLVASIIKREVEKIRKKND